MPIFFHSKAQGFQALNPHALCADSLKQLLENIHDFTGENGKIYKSDRQDLFYSLAQTKTPRKRDESGDFLSNSWIKCEVLAFDLDKISDDDLKKYDQYLDVVSEVLNVDADFITQVISGRGLHFLIFLDEPITDPHYFKRTKPLYKTICRLLDDALKSKNLSGQADPNVYDHARILRLPGTLNTKTDPPRRCETLNLSTTPVPISVESILGIPVVEESKQITQSELVQTQRTYDQKYIENECRFLTFTKEEPLAVREPEGYAALSILGRLDPSLELAKKYYQEWKNSSSLRSSRFDEKVSHALKSSGPRTCQGISELWSNGSEKYAEKCHACPHYGKITSPILLKGPDFISTQDSGFWLTTKKGSKVPHYDDLLKAYTSENKYYCDPDSRQVWSWIGTHYVATSELKIHEWCETKMNPKPSHGVRQEFLHKVRANHVLRSSELTQPVEMINLKNGILNTRTKLLTGSDSRYDFKYVLPYSYDPTARAPLFETMLDNVTDGDPQLKQMLLEMFAFTLIDGYQGMQEAFWWLSGTGENGKSRLLKVLSAFVGEENVARFSIDQLHPKDRFSISFLEGKRLCIVEESGLDYLDKEIVSQLKALSGGEPRTVERKGIHHWNMVNKAKFVFTSNHEPRFGDTTHGLTRRFYPIPFDVNFSDQKWKSKADPEIANKVIATELPGVLNRVLDLLPAIYQRKGTLFRAKASEDLREELMRDSSPFNRWFSDKVKVTNDLLVTTPFKELYSSYLSAVDDGETKMLTIKFSKELKSKGLKCRRKMIGDSKETLYQGVYLVKDSGSGF